MARTYVLRNLTDDKGRPLSNVWTRAFNATTSALAETQYTDNTGTCTFTTLPDDANVNICAVWGDNAKWLYNVYSATQDLLYLSVTDAIIANATITDAKISTCSIGKLTAGNLTVTGTLTTGSFVTGAAGTNRIEITSAKIAGISSANVEQFYIQASDGKGYFGTGGCVLDALGLTINNATIATAALRFVNGAGVLSTMYQYSDGDFSIQADRYMLLGADSARVLSQCTFAPSVAGSFDLGMTGLYWNNFFYKVLSDQGCPVPMIPSALDVIKNMKTKKRKLTLEDVEREDMGSRARDRVLKNEGGEFEEIDKDSYPDELLVKPKESDYEQAKKDYEDNVAKAKERGRDWTKIKEYIPKIGLCTNELVYMHTKGIQELAGRLEVLEQKI